MSRWRSVYVAMGRACAGQKVSSRSIGARPTAAPIGSTATARCVEEFEDGKRRPVGPGRRISRRRRGDPRPARRPAAAAGRHGRLQPRLGRSALRPLPGRARRSRRQPRLGRASATAIVPGVSYVTTARRRHARRGSAAARRRRRRPDPRRLPRLPPGHAQQMGRCSTAAGSPPSARS